MMSNRCTCKWLYQLLMITWLHIHEAVAADLDVPVQQAPMVVGSVATLRCPYPFKTSIEWHKNLDNHGDEQYVYIYQKNKGTEPRFDPKLKNRFDVVNQTVLRINNTNFDDNGVYTCRINSEIKCIYNLSVVNETVVTEVLEAESTVETQKHTVLLYVIFIIVGVLIVCVLIVVCLLWRYRDKIRKWWSMKKKGEPNSLQPVDVNAEEEEEEETDQNVTRKALLSGEARATCNPGEPIASTSLMDHTDEVSSSQHVSSQGDSENIGLSTGSKPQAVHEDANEKLQQAQDLHNLEMQKLKEECERINDEKAKLKEELECKNKELERKNNELECKIIENMKVNEEIERVRNENAKLKEQEHKKDSLIEKLITEKNKNNREISKLKGEIAALKAQQAQQAQNQVQYSERQAQIDETLQHIQRELLRQRLVVEQVQSKQKANANNQDLEPNVEGFCMLHADNLNKNIDK